jgi:cytochrome P450
MIVLNSHGVHYNSTIYSNPSSFRPERFLVPENDEKNGVPRNAFRSFERGPRACLGQSLAMEELRVILLLTVRDFEFEAIVKPNTQKRASYTDLDKRIGDLAFQALGLEAKPRGGAMMSVMRRVK